ncbi:PREDICTED: diacylglycerol kinase 3-like isoform X2 [Populus euphratica]|uniref:Diacylglycerol kinase 3-like isoform X2 n=1 Tax=Populus euphratica TaxID=75702 RepID=A0AAJ6XGY1_POPEU|nr:PREDICTED: diacylglycerol kinase 3-like isoform X2 [Populus euphratica]
MTMCCLDHLYDDIIFNVCRGLENIIRMHVKKVNCSEWEQIPVPKIVRAIVALNLHSYASGRNPWGSPKPEYLEKFKL